MQSRAAPWMGVGLLGSVALATVALGWLGMRQRATVTALQLTARWAYLLFWPAYVGGGTSEPQCFGRRLSAV